MTRYILKRTIIGRLDKGTDLHEGIMSIVSAEHIRLGRITGIGAVQKATLAFYDQEAKKYGSLRFDSPMEIINMSGNISIKDGAPFAHVHVVLSDEKGNGRGGHLVPGGTPVFACELIIEEFEGPELVREPDSQTGLTLWPETVGTPK